MDDVTDTLELIEEELHNSVHANRITDGERNKACRFVQSAGEIKMALEEALEDYESNAADDGDTDESGFHVPGWVVLAREVLK